MYKAFTHEMTARGVSNRDTQEERERAKSKCRYVYALVLYFVGIHVNMISLKHVDDELSVALRCVRCADDGIFWKQSQRQEQRMRDKGERQPWHRRWISSEDVSHVCACDDSTEQSLSTVFSYYYFRRTHAPSAFSVHTAHFIIAHPRCATQTVFPAESVCVCVVYTTKHKILPLELLGKYQRL